MTTIAVAESIEQFRERFSNITRYAASSATTKW
jgi:hypothetical protein